MRKALESNRSLAEAPGSLTLAAVELRTEPRTLQEGQAFNKVAQEYSEDKAKSQC